MTTVSGMISKSDLAVMVVELEAVRFSLYALTMTVESLSKRLKNICEAPVGPPDSSLLDEVSLPTK